MGTCKQNFYEVVIPNYFDPEDFEYCEDKDDYFLFMGRVYEGKGIHIAIETTKLIGAKLIVAGQNSLKSCGYDPVPPHVTEFGYAGIEDRKKLMSKAKRSIRSIVVRRTIRRRTNGNAHVRNANNNHRLGRILGK